ncbi:transketolase [Dyadobacter sp. BE34]|uniref:Transketolase n=1 Tax=Dyadobacter fermentans TaxID=94254 RepID=A0ABU1R5E7_9BACT|nr:MULTISPECIES: transketolase [Dyadobacter]MDR6808583.1 transketolase [Dyadobacter fermentans]MDR7046326.1 transketolase [Dyadobacter sp. BE242]MDR7200639.1 transketolase [Dyadobacter sp. BE34]MDR7218599.1 transketolase [Dyadobacter sp. BE31]MDR7266529.1 transketolase [Dyadobacter sp. BE32]
MSEKELAQKSVGYRKKILKYIYQAKAGHTGGSLSCIDILNVLYNHTMNVGPGTFDSPDRDRYIQSKGHTVEALYVVLASRGFFPESDLETLCKYQSHYIGHPTRKVRGVEQNTGALGHGLSLSVGTAIAGKLDKRDYRVFTVLGDGELPEGSNWEAALSASHYKLDNLCAILDKNTLQISGPTSAVCNTDPVDEKFEAFGWAVRHVDGHDIGELMAAFDALPFEEDKPSLIIAHTVKGKGVSYMENQLKWHHGVPDKQEYADAIQELDALEVTLA